MSTIGGQGKKGRKTNFAQAWQRALQSALNLSYTIDCMLSENEGKRLCFHVRFVLYLIPLKTLRESDGRIIRMSFC